VKPRAKPKARKPPAAGPKKVWRKPLAEQQAKILAAQLAIGMKSDGMGRPRRKFDLKKAREFGYLRFSMRDMAAFFCTSEQILNDRLKEVMPDDPAQVKLLPKDWGTFRSAYEMGVAACSKMLRKTIIQMAKDGNEKMLLHCAAHYLGQVPQSQMELNAKAVTEIRFTIKARDDVDDLPSANIEQAALVPGGAPAPAP